MLKREITYTDFFTDEEVTETFYFNLTKQELKEMQFSQPGGFSAQVERAIETGNLPILFMEFKKLVLAAYGERGEDGKSFNKSPEIAEAFTRTAAYDQLFNELTEVPGALQEFLKGIMPKDVTAQIDFDAVTAEALAKLPAPTPPEAPNG